MCCRIVDVQAVCQLSVEFDKTSENTVGLLVSTIHIRIPNAPDRLPRLGRNKLLLPSACFECEFSPSMQSRRGVLCGRPAHPISSTVSKEPDDVVRILAWLSTTRGKSDILLSLFHEKRRGAIIDENSLSNIEGISDRADIVDWFVAPPWELWSGHGGSDFDDGTHKGRV